MEITVEKKLHQVIPENEFQECFQQWCHHLMKCIASQGEYIEDDHS